MHKQTVIDQIEVRRDGAVQVRFGKLRVKEDGTLDGEPSWHRTIFNPETDIDAQMAVVNAHLVSMGEAMCEASCVDRLKTHASAARTPEVVAARNAVLEKERAEAEQRQALAEQQAAEAETARKAAFDAAVAEAVERQKAA